GDGPQVPGMRPATIHMAGSGGKAELAWSPKARARRAPAEPPVSHRYGRGARLVQPSLEGGTRMAFDVGRVRAAYPALRDGYAYREGPAGTQVPAEVIEAIGGAYMAGLSNAGGAFPASGRADAVTSACRQAVADLVGGDPAGVILGPNMTTL